MPTLKNSKKIAVGGAILAAAAWFAVSPRWATQAAVTPAPQAATAKPSASATVVETMPIVPAEITEARRGKDWMDTANKTDW